MSPGAGEAPKTPPQRERAVCSSCISWGPALYRRPRVRKAGRAAKATRGFPRRPCATAVPPQRGAGQALTGELTPGAPLLRPGGRPSGSPPTPPAPPGLGEPTHGARRAALGRQTPSKLCPRWPEGPPPHYRCRGHQRPQRYMIFPPPYPTFRMAREVTRSPKGSKRRSWAKSVGGERPHLRLLALWHAARGPQAGCSGRWTPRASWRQASLREGDALPGEQQLRFPAQLGTTDPLPLGKMGGGGPNQMHYFFSSRNETSGTCSFLVSCIVVAPFFLNTKASVNREGGRAAPSPVTAAPGPGRPH